MTPEQIKQLAEELFQIKEIDYAELIGYTHADLREDARMRFADGYTTCQQTEVEPLQKEIETVKNLLVRVHTAHSYGKFTDDLYNEITEIVDNENYIDSRDKEIERLKGIINNSIRINLLTASLQAR